MHIYGKVIRIMQKKIKVLAAFSLIENANEFYWYAQYLDKNKFELTCIFYHPSISKIQNEILSLGINCYLIKYHGKKNIFSAFFQTCKLLLKLKPNIIHAQLFDASLIMLTVAWLLRFKNRVHTRHHSDIHHKYHPQAIKYDKWINFLSKKIICPSEQIKSFLISKENVNLNKIIVVPHGFDFTYLQNGILQKNNIKEKYNINGFPIIGCVSRFTEWKGVQFIIPAFKRFLDYYPNSLLVMAGYNGDYENNIFELLEQIPQSNYRLIEFEKNNAALFSNFDIFVHVPISITSETFGQIYVEAFAMSIPSIITLSGIAADDKTFYKYAKVVRYMNSIDILNALLKITQNIDDYKKKMVVASNIIKNKYDFKNKIITIENEYLSLYK